MFKKTLETAKYTVKLSVQRPFLPFCVRQPIPTAFSRDARALTPRALPAGRRSTCPPAYRNGDFRAA